jgi:hypothetical protein
MSDDIHPVFFLESNAGKELVVVCWNAAKLVLLTTLFTASGAAQEHTREQAFMKNPLRKTEPVTQEIPLGVWGGEHISLELTASGGTVEFDCAHGTLSRKLVPDKNGRFIVPGTYVEERGGPVRANEQAHEYAVRYAGVVKNGRMTLTVTRSATNKRMGSFKLAHGQEAMLFKCR